jgi:spore germination protein YaaH
VAVPILLGAPGGAEARPAASSAWIPYWDQDAATRVVAAHPGVFGAASPFWFQADGARAIRAYPGARDRGVLRRLRRGGIAVIPTVTSSMRPYRAIRVLGRSGPRRRHVRALVRLARPFRGLDFDYEYPALTRSRPVARRVRRALNLFFAEVCAALRRQRRRCVVTVMPRTGPFPRVWRGKLIPWVYDYGTLGEAADRVRVMAYDQHAPGTLPGPIAGAPWVERVARFAAREIDLSKLELGIPLYGRDWVRGSGSAESLTWRQARGLRRSAGARYRWSRRQLAPWFRYDGHVVWYSDRRSSLARARIARELGLAGAAFWAPGAEDPGTWRLVRGVL